MQNLLSTFLTYLFTTVIYLFILSVIILIYRDITHVYSKKSKTPAAFLKLSRRRKFPNLSPEYPLNGAPVLVGRGKSCGVRLPSPDVSAEHFQLWRDADGWFIADMGSTNGTFLNGERLTDDVAKLLDGDGIRVGEIEFSFEEV